MYEKAREELQKIEPKIDLLHEVLGIGLYASITQTSDGYFLGMRFGDIGYNDFLGRPSEVALWRTWMYLEMMSEEARQEAESALSRFQL